jgi:hypothetical protein
LTATSGESVTAPFDTIETISGNGRHAPAASTSHEAARVLIIRLRGSREPRAAKDGRMSMSGLSLQSTNLDHADARQSEAIIPTDLLAGLLMEQIKGRRPQAPGANSLPTKVYGVMAATTLLTFVTLCTGYQFLFSQQLFG